MRLFYNEPHVDQNYFVSWSTRLSHLTYVISVTELSAVQ